MKATLKAVLAASLLIAPAAFATKVPIPIEGATLNVSVQVQTQALINENGAVNGHPELGMGHICKRIAKARALFLSVYQQAA